MLTKVWPLCQVCGKPVSTQQGFLIVLHNELDQYQDQHLQWEERHPFDANGVISHKDLMEMPERVKWHWGHSSCLPEGGYDIAYARFNTISKALYWTLHLMKKNWFPFTQWEPAVRAHHQVPYS